VGGGKLHRNFTDLREIGHDRRLPIPALTSAGGRLLVAWFLATALLLAVGIWLAWKRWDSWTEPNASRRFGSAAPNEVVKADFCVIDRAGTYDLLRRCR
jgi:hypothetical protein